MKKIKPFWEKEKEVLKKTFLSKKSTLVQRRKFEKEWKEYKEFGYSRSDMWSLDVSLSKIIVPRLEMFLKDCSDSGVPGVFIENKELQILSDDYYSKLRKFNEVQSKKNKKLADEAEKKFKKLDKEVMENGKKLWKAELSKMIEAFKIIGDEKHICPSSDDVRKKVNEGLESFAKHFTSLWY